MNLAPRPDELAQDARNEIPNRLRKAANTAATAVTGAAGAAIGAKVLPWLNELIPVDLAIKGISKIHPKLGEFFKAGIKSGLDPREGMDLWKNKIEENEDQSKESQSAQENRGIVEQHSPELHQFILGEIQKGKTPMQAGVESTRGNNQFTKIIKKLMSEYRMPWSAIIESVYGKEKGLSSKQEAAKKYNERNKGLMAQETDRFNQEYGQQTQQPQPMQQAQPSQMQPAQPAVPMQQPQQQQMGQTKSALLQAVQQGNQILQNMIK